MATGFEDLSVVAGVLLMVGVVAAAVSRVVSKREARAEVNGLTTKVDEIQDAQLASMRALAHVIPDYQATIERFNPEIAARFIRGEGGPE